MLNDSFAMWARLGRLCWFISCQITSLLLVLGRHFLSSLSLIDWDGCQWECGRFYFSSTSRSYDLWLAPMQLATLNEFRFSFFIRIRAALNDCRNVRNQENTHSLKRMLRSIGWNGFAQFCEWHFHVCLMSRSLLSGLENMEVPVQKSRMKILHFFASHTQSQPTILWSSPCTFFSPVFLVGNKQLFLSSVVIMHVSKMCWRC